jgi:hypothetical protein
MCRFLHSAVLEPRFTLWEDGRPVTAYGKETFARRKLAGMLVNVRDAQVSLLSCRRPCVSESLTI